MAQLRPYLRPQSLRPGISQRLPGNHWSLGKNVHSPTGLQVVAGCCYVRWAAKRVLHTLICLGKSYAFTNVISKISKSTSFWRPTVSAKCLQTSRHLLCNHSNLLATTITARTLSVQHLILGAAGSQVNLVPSALWLPWHHWTARAKSVKGKQSENTHFA